MTEFDFCPWLFWSHATEEDRQVQADHVAELRGRMDLEAPEGVFISPLAAVYADRLRMGDRCYQNRR
ncbi:hypothetical protein ETD86_13625 [Nonomuraea turkmeniaca]|uniref:Uncharacterized protein n=1 Tax=Nonomuraea turkmeniaca TaxID=103838 RepID=A0A5S4FN15_9ACTN|nr:hypothetical protein [Nonomuraea turkmeniaca]TMR21834.1 hypothetical protein ETD86_13625 [Nonomuraea turkmeniaca]